MKKTTIYGFISCCLLCHRTTEASRLMGIPVNDHEIVGTQGDVSLQQKGVKS